MRRGQRGRGRLRSGANSPSASRRAFISSNCRVELARAQPAVVGDVELVGAAGLVDGDGPADEVLVPVLQRLEGRPGAGLLPEEDAAQLAEAVAQGEVGVP